MLKVKTAVPIAHLVAATGDVEILSSDDAQWRQVPANEEAAVTEGARIRTDSRVCCELATSDDCTIRIDEDSELVLRNNKHCEVIRGQVWCKTPKDTFMQLEVPVDGIDGELLAFKCPSDSSAQWSVDKFSASCSSSAQQPSYVSYNDLKCTVDPGTTVTLNTQPPIQQTREATGIPAAVWQLPLLAISRRDDSGSIQQELIATLSPLLAPIGFTKATHMNERHLIQLGPPGALPLISYVRTDSSRSDEAKRRTAMRIACQIADETSISLLRELVEDKDEFVSKLAVTTLQRFD